MSDYKKIKIVDKNTGQLLDEVMCKDEQARSNIASLTETVNGKVSKSGDTMTGSLSIVVADANAKGTPTANTNKGVLFRDGNDTIFGSIRYYQYADDGRTALTLQAQRDVGSSDTLVTNYLQLVAYADGTREVHVSNADIWRNALGLEFSEWSTLINSSAFTGTIYYVKLGNVVYMTAENIKPTSAISAGSNYHLIDAGIPSAYRPSKNVDMYAGDSSRDGMIYVTTTGNIIFFARDAYTTDSPINFTISYIVD